MMKIMVTNVETLNQADLTMAEFDELSINKKQTYDHILFTVEELVEELNNPQYEFLDPEYNIFTLIKENKDA